MFNDLSDENWKNSEVVQIFAANVIKDRHTVSYAPHDVPSDPPKAPVLSTSTAQYDQFTKKQQALAEIALLTVGLRKAASEAGTKGDHQGALAIERVIAEIEEVGAKIIEEPNA